MGKKEQDKLIEVLWVKSIIYTLIIILLVILFIFVPKKVFKENLSFQLATSMAIISDDNLLLYDYQVYSTEERFNDGLIYDAEDVKLDFKERNEIVAIKIYGENDTIKIRDDFIFITSPDTPQLNIEYHLVKDMEFNGINLPCRTFIMLFKDISKLINNIYLGLILIVSISIFAPISIKLTRNVTYITKFYKKA